MSKKHSILIIVILVILGAVAYYWFWQSQIPPVVTNPTSKNEPAKIPVTNFKRYEGNTLPSQFPTNFPNPALAGDVLLNNSMTLGGVIPTDQSIYKFTTKTSIADILKLYSDYLTKNKWIIDIKQDNPNAIRARKGLSNIGIIVSSQPDSAKTLVTISINALAGTTKLK